MTSGWSGWGVGLDALGLAPSPIVAGAILLAIGTMNGYVNITVIAWVQAGPTRRCSAGR